MEEKKLFAKLVCRISSLSVFRNILKNTVITKYINMLINPSPDSVGAFCEELYRHTDNLTEFILGTVIEDENCFMLRHAAMEEIPAAINEAAHEELRIIEEAASVTHDMLRKEIRYDGYLPRWTTLDINFSEVYAEHMAELSTKGYGIFAKYTSFLFKDGSLVPLKHPDPQRLSQLAGYETERRKLIDNTKALLAGAPAANVLLYGDAGTGKSSSVKAVANEFAADGIRLIELKKPQLHDLPVIIEQIAHNPLKFIIFTDDLTFAANDDDFDALKAALEGSAAAKSSNAVIYATSNLRHLVREKFSDRSGDEIHARDSMEELVSLSERFGLKITFTKPNKELYLKVVETLAEQYGLECDKDVLFSKAEAYALRRSGRSGRAARQFVEMMLSGQL